MDQQAPRQARAAALAAGLMLPPHRQRTILRVEKASTTFWVPLMVSNQQNKTLARMVMCIRQAVAITVSVANLTSLSGYADRQLQ